MKHAALLIVALLLGGAAMAQANPRPRVATADTSTHVSIMFNYQRPPSRLLVEAANHRRNAVLVPLAGCAAGYAFVWAGYENPLNGGETNPLVYVGYGVAAVSAVAGIVNWALSIHKERRAGEELRKITISAGGATYHF